MYKDPGTYQTGVTDIAKLVEMAREEIASGKVKYITLEQGRQAEMNQILRWIIDHSPKWRSDGSAEIEEEMRRLGL